jgi:hypothetical protein
MVRGHDVDKKSRVDEVVNSFHAESLSLALYSLREKI